MEKILKMHNNDKDIIKTFLKIETTKETNSSLYSLDLSKNIFSLYSPEKIKQDFELDKIFTNKDENSYIYEIICLNTIKECIKGMSYTFISFGETINNKIEFLIGDMVNNYKNINYYGIFIRLLENLLNKKNAKEFEYSIKFSNFLIFDNNLIDLTFFGNTKKEEYEIDTDLFLSNSFKIKNDSNIINNMNKINVNNINEIIKYLHHIMKFLYKLDKNIYSKSNICFMIYLVNEQVGKTVSTINFISLCGSENLYAEQIQILNNKKNNSNDKSKNVLEATKFSIETRFTFDSIINCLVNNNYIYYNKIEKNNKNEEKNNKDKEKDEGNDKKGLSKLTMVLYDICFGKNISNIKFRFIGNVKPVEGYYQSLKDVLLFLFECSKIMKKILSSKKNSLKNGEKNEKGDEIFNLEYKIKVQSKTINDLNNNLDRQSKKIIFLEKSYRQQINVFKKYFGFNGDINLLLSGEPNTKEMKYVEKIKNHNLLVLKYENTIENLEKKLSVANEEIKRLKNKLSTKENEQTMINYYLSINKNQEEKLNMKNNENLKELYNKIDKLNKDIINKNKIIEELKKDLDKKNLIFCNLPKSIINQIQKIDDKDKDTNINSTKSGLKNKNNINDLNNTELTEISFKQELNKLKIKEQKNIQELKEKYNYILLEKKNALYELEHKFEKIDEEYKYEFKKIISELSRIYGMLMSLITYIENHKKLLFEEKNIEELKSIIFSIKDDITNENYPFLFKELNNQKKSTEKKEEKKVDEISLEKEKSKDNNKENNKEKEKEIKIIINNAENVDDMKKDEIIEKLKNKVKRLMLNNDMQIKKYNNNVFLLGLQQRTIEKLNQEINTYKQTLKNKNITPPIISLKNNSIINNNESKHENKNISKLPDTGGVKNKIIQKSFSYNIDKGNMELPFKYIRNCKFNENEGYNNIDSLRQPSTNNTNFNSFFRASSPDSSYSNTNSNYFNNSLYNKKKNNNNINTALFIKKMKNENKNRRPFSAIRERDNFCRKFSKTKNY